MRFHIGFSKRISWKWLLLIGGGLLAFFGIGNHAVLAATSMSADATKVSALSPQADTYIPQLGQTITSGNLINVSNGTPYCTTWSSQRYCAFQLVNDPKSIGYRDSIQNARLRWYYSKASMAKCSSGQYVTYEYKLFLRNITSGTLPQLWDTSGLYSKIFLRTGGTNYTCSLSDDDSHVLTATCTIPNPDDEVQFIIEGFTIPYGSVIDNGYYNVGAMPVSYECSSDSSGIIINNQNQNTEQIINNNNNNTQQIIDSQNQINDNLTDSNISSDTTSHAGTFFNTTLNDHGLSVIVTAPIRLLQGMLNSANSCNDLVLFTSIFGQDKLVTMPSGCILWNQAPSSVVTIYQITIFGLFGYFVLVDIWHTVNAVLDPERKNDYVMDL